MSGAVQPRVFALVGPSVWDVFPPDVHTPPPSLYSVSVQRSPCHSRPCWRLYIKDYPYHYSLSVYLPLFLLLTMVTVTWRSCKMLATLVEGTSATLGNGASSFSILSWWKPGRGPSQLWQVYHQAWSSSMGTIRAPSSGHWQQSWLGMANRSTHLQANGTGRGEQWISLGANRTSTQAGETSPRRSQTLALGCQLLRAGFMTILLTAVSPHHNWYILLSQWYLLN